ncbi:M1 family metallopeptidase [Methanococcoides methylutens]|uniref:Membrane alanine aminopeptidase N n=1 Tax=Methanococcoides methylutens MM1 TaxID=1434104 RepID=A0A0E3SR20_METMT|nr:M1 family metallopeptidase [Methanococcoides methylutens]AKB84668.1 Membrane alanine aminopeptidase N [Methanococcoides methylutens MM1]
MERIYKYYPEDFGELTVRVIHMDLLFDVYDDHTYVTSDLKVRTLEEPIGSLDLNCRDLDIKKISCEDCDVSYDYRKAEHILTIEFGCQVPSDTEIVIHTETVCKPTRNILEGLYYDETPAGAPPQQITQCQQWGFQRIVPCIDDMTAKCTYRTTIIADERYTNLITNGDVVEEKHSVGNGRAKIVYDNSVTPMATYLFFLGVGTYRTFTREFEYPDGHTFNLELLVPPESDAYPAEKALDVIYDSVMWTYLFTGPEQYNDIDKRKEIYDLVRVRDALKSEGNTDDLKFMRDELMKLDSSLIMGYKYTGTVYREIGMQNSDFGGMENVGNTTITTNRIMPYPETTDPSFEYMVRVKVHEYYHNINGSEVTGWSPFEIWLNEAVTVHIEHQFHAFIFGENYSRLSNVLDLLAPGVGTFALDSGAASMSIVPEGFNDPNDLITAVTYVKAPEFVRMLETLMGKEVFARALDVYHTKFSHSNATGSDWLKTMEEVSGMDFSEMSETWLSQTKFPMVHVDTSYDPKDSSFTLDIHQDVPEGGKHWEFPFVAALVDEGGNDIVQINEWIDSVDASIRIEDVEAPAFVSVNRDYSFYGKVVREVSDEELLLQVRKDSDMINRFIAYYTLVDREKMRLIDNPKAQVSEMFIELFNDLINDDLLMEEVGGQFLAIFESVEDERLAHSYQLLYDVKKRILEGIARNNTVSLLNLYHKYLKMAIPQDDTLEEHARVIKARQVMNAVLRIIATLDTPFVHQLCKKQFFEASCASDRLVAFDCYINSSAEDKMELLWDFMEDSRKNLVAWEAFLSIVAGNSSSDAVSIVKEIESSDSFRIEQANDQRALYGGFGRNRKISLQTEEGRELLHSILLKLSSVNEYSTTNLLNVFANIDLMEEEYHIPLVSILADMLDTLDPEKVPSVYNRIRKLLQGSPNAVAAYEADAGKLKGM